MRAAAFLACLASPALAEPPSELEVLDTLVREAPQLQTTGSVWTEQAEHGAVRFVTMMLYELGVYLPESEDSGSIGVSCDAEGDDWLCRVAFGIKWSGAESAYVGTMTLQRIEGDCDALSIDIHGPYGAGCWTVRDGILQIDLYG